LTGTCVSRLPLRRLTERTRLSALQAQLKLSDGQTDFHFDNLFIARMLLINKGNSDIPEFTFGISLATGDTAIFVEPKCSDRHHTATFLTPVSLSSQTSEIDIQLRPFNRFDAYTLNVFIVTRSGQRSPGDIRLSSPRSVRFVPLPSIAEFTADVALQVAKTFFLR